MSDVICTRPGCGKPINEPTNEIEKFFVIASTGQIISLKRHKECISKDSALRAVGSQDRRLLLSPASAMTRMMADRRAANNKRSDYLRKKKICQDKEAR